MHSIAKRISILLWAALLSGSVAGQEVTIQERQVVSGQIIAKTNHSLGVQTETGQTYSVLYQDQGVKAISLSGGAGAVNLKAKIKVHGHVPLVLVRPGMALEAEVELASHGEVAEVKRWKLLPVDHDEYSVTFAGETPTSKTDFQIAIAQGSVVKLERGNVFLKLPKSEWAPKGGLILPAVPDAQMQIDETSMQEVRVGDHVVSMEAFRFSTGDWGVREMEIALKAERTAVQADPEQVYELKYRHLSNQPEAPREIRSKNFIVKTDLSPRSTQILLDKLEEMHSIIGKYYNRRSLGQPIYCYVADDLKLWESSIHELAEGLDSIRTQAGVTVATRLGNLRRAVVFACGDHSVVQHEAVHAFCHLGFGGVGPIWYAEGMAELGCYWRPGDVGVNIDPVVIRYLTTTPPMPLLEVVRPGQLTGDSWQAYAWRWALCYMMVNNPNYAQRFYRLGDLMMRPNTNASFHSEFANVASEISFEYLQFVQNMGNGYQQELCSWDWKTKATRVEAGRWKKCEVEAKRGWQASSGLVKQGEVYEVLTEGQWSVVGSELFSADGRPDGLGRLIGAVLTKHDPSGDQIAYYTLSDDIELGTKTTFTAPASGQLFLRCREPLTQIGDNTGKIKVAIRVAER